MHDKRPGAMHIVRKYVFISGAVGGLMTVPVIDVTMLAGVHVALIKELTKYYGDEFHERAARAIVAAIVASLIPGSFGSIIGRRVLRALPFVTPAIVMLTWAASSAVVSYGLGMIFVRHYEAGGTLANFDLEHLHRVFSTETLTGMRLT
jgi:uncharacterized protein (DUF697 family)